MTSSRKKSRAVPVPRRISNQAERRLALEYIKPRPSEFSTPRGSATLSEPKHLESFLTSANESDGFMQLSEVDGFLAAVAIGPESVMPSEWLPVICDPAVLSSQKAAVGVVMERYNEIVRQLQHEPAAYVPFLGEPPGSERLASHWAGGFMTGVALRPNAWRSLLESGDDSMLLLPIASLVDDEEGNPLINGKSESLSDVRRTSPRLIAVCVVSINAYWKR